MELIGRAEQRTDAPPGRVWAVLADIAGWKTWMPGVRWAVLEREFGPDGYVTIKPERGRQTAYRIDAVVGPGAASARRAAPVAATGGWLFALGLTFGPLAALRRSWILEPHEDGTIVVHAVEIGGPLRRRLTAPLAERLHAEAPSVLAALAAVLAPGVGPVGEGVGDQGGDVGG